MGSITIEKRNGTSEGFIITKIMNSVESACKETMIGENSDGCDIHPIDIAMKVADIIYNDYIIPACNVSRDIIIASETMIEIVCRVLNDIDKPDISKRYKKISEDKIISREKDMPIMKEIAEIDVMTNRSNANVGHSPSSKVLQISEAASTEYYLTSGVVPEVHAKAHIDGDYYIHDLAWYGKTMTCLQIPLGRLLSTGFSTGHGSIRPPKSIKTASALAAIILQSNQNDQHGGQAYAHFDRDMAPYVEKEFERQTKYVHHLLDTLAFDSQTIDEDEINAYVYKLVEEEVFQAMEGFIYNLNTMSSRAGAQVPFSSINLGLDTSVGGRMITQMTLKAYEKGLGKGECPIFPNICFKIKSGVNYNPEDPNYDLFRQSMTVACKRLFPNFSFQDSSFNKDYEDSVAYMGCRTRVIGDVFGKEFEKNDGRGNLSFTTINLPRLGILSNGDMGEFWKGIDTTMDAVCDQLLARYELQKNLKVRDFPFMMGEKLYVESEKLGPDDTIEESIKHGTLSIGFIGLAETLVALTGKHHGESVESQALGLSIISYMNRKCKEYTEKYHLNFSLFATPAEGLSGKFVIKDAERFGIIEGVTDKEWYTNSFHVPVEYPIEAFDKIKIEGAYHKYCGAGHISYVELPSAPTHNIEAFESLIRAMYDADMGYAAVNFPVDVCKVCGYNGVIETNTCPACGSVNKISRVRRITGYLAPLEMFNDAKKAEVEHRVQHMK